MAEKDGQRSREIRSQGATPHRLNAQCSSTVASVEVGMSVSVCVWTSGPLFGATLRQLHSSSYSETTELAAAAAGEAN